MSTYLGNTLVAGVADLSNYRTASAQDVIDATKQAQLVSGSNIKTINGTSVLGSGNITIEGKSNLSELNDVTVSSPVSGQYLSWDGTKWINTTSNALKNYSSGAYSLVISTETGKQPTALEYSVSVGDFSTANSNYSTTVGTNANCYITSEYAIAIGSGARTYGRGSIQLGRNANPTYSPGTFSVSLTTDGSTWNNYKLLGPDGNIPHERMGDAIQLVNQLPASPVSGVLYLIPET